FRSPQGCHLVGAIIWHLSDGSSVGACGSWYSRRLRARCARRNGDASCSDEPQGYTGCCGDSFTGTRLGENRHASRDSGCLHLHSRWTPDRAKSKWVTEVNGVAAIEAIDIEPAAEPQGVFLGEARRIGIVAPVPPVVCPSRIGLVHQHRALPSIRGLPGAEIGELAPVDPGIDAAVLGPGIDAERRGPGGRGAAIDHAVDPALVIPEPHETEGRIRLPGD